jgi:phospholipase/carboxylesterase
MNGNAITCNAQTLFPANVLEALNVIAKIRSSKNTFMTEPSLPFLERPPRTQSGAAAPLVILLHGRGAEAKTIFSVEGLLDPSYQVLAFTGLYDSAIDGKEWFHPREDIPGEITDAKQFDESERVLTENVEGHISRLGADRSKLFLWGFSQGAAMALILGLRGIVKPRGVIAMSGFLPTPVKRWKKFDTSSQYLLPHGSEDEVLAAESSKSAKSFLESKGIDAEYYEYKGRHKMSMESIAYVNNWILRLSNQVS